MLILGLLDMYFDAAVVFVTSQTLFLRLALAILWREHIYLIKQFKICNFSVKRLLFKGGFHLRGNNVNRSLSM